MYKLCGNELDYFVEIEEEYAIIGLKVGRLCSVFQLLPECLTFYQMMYFYLNLNLIRPHFDKLTNKYCYCVLSLSAAVQVYGLKLGFPNILDHGPLFCPGLARGPLI